MTIWRDNCIHTAVTCLQRRRRGSELHSIAWWPTVIVLAVATFTDLRSRRIPNWLVLPFMVAGVAVSFAPPSWHGIGFAQSLEGLGLGILLIWHSRLDGRDGDGRCEAVRCDWRMGRVRGSYSWRWWSPALSEDSWPSAWAAMGGFLGELFTGTEQSAFWLEEGGMQADPELNAFQPAGAQDAVRSGYRDRYPISFFAR